MPSLNCIIKIHSFISLKVSLKRWKGSHKRTQCPFSRKEKKMAWKEKNKFLSFQMYISKVAFNFINWDIKDHNYLWIWWLMTWACGAQIFSDAKTVRRCSHYWSYTKGLLWGTGGRALSQSGTTYIHGFNISRLKMLYTVMPVSISALQRALRMCLIHSMGLVNQIKDS